MSRNRAARGAPRRPDVRGRGPLASALPRGGEGGSLCALARAGAAAAQSVTSVYIPQKAVSWFIFALVRSLWNFAERGSLSPRVGAARVN